ncbi:MAG: molybdopterin molybdotransferase MoeA [Microbacteriaceae bacterium]|nr:molybdopterin molybdotransferase MoeA [Microbacteriaceae bacterium]
MNRSHPSPDWATARQLALTLATALPAETVGIEQAADRTLANDLPALTDVPHYASSAMDGWVVAGDAPWLLVNGIGDLPPGQAREIVTGGLIPVGAVGVLRSENGVPRSDGVAAAALLDRGPTASPDEPFAGQHIRLAGEEVREGAVIIAAGTVLNPVHLAVAAIAGHDTVQVRRRPRVGLILSGSEVVESGIAAPGFVRDAFGPQLPSFLALLGGVVVAKLRISDDQAQTEAAFGPKALGLTAAETDVLVTTGGTSNSSADHMRRALASVGATIVIDGIRMRPGGPTFVARLVDGRFVACLPGNPLAAIMGLLTVVAPLIAGLRGETNGDEPRDSQHGGEIERQPGTEPGLGQVHGSGPGPGLGQVHGPGPGPGPGQESGLGLGTTVLSHDILPAKGSSRLLPFRETADGAVVSDWLGSGMLRGLAEADAVLVCPPAGAQAGETVTTLELPWTRRARSR